MKYKVEISYYDFIFDDAEEAMTFAQTAKTSHSKDKDGHDFEITITLIEEDKED